MSVLCVFVCFFQPNHGAPFVVIAQHHPDDLVALLMHESEKALEGGMDYVFRTVNAAL